MKISLFSPYSILSIPSFLIFSSSMYSFSKKGTGSYASVKLGVDKSNNSKVAIKFYEKIKLFDP